MRYLYLFIALFLVSHLSLAQFQLTLESGFAFNSRNDVRYFNEEGNKGDLFSLANDFEVQHPVVYARVEAKFKFLEKNIVELTAAPLAFNYDKRSNANIVFGNNTYGLSNESVKGRYEFNTYRASYRYQFINSDKWYLAAGATALIRDARIALTENNLTEETTDLGFVPLLSFDARYKCSDDLEFLLKGDALVGPQGRAEDILVGLQYMFKLEGLSARAGYRIIEGGADVSQVYNFSLINFVSLGLQYRLNSVK